MEYLLKCNAIIVIFYMSYKVLLQHDTFFEYNRWFLLTGLATAVFIPLIVIPIYVEQPLISLDNLVFLDTDATTGINNNGFNLMSFLGTIYLIGVIIFALRFILQLRALILVLTTNQRNKYGQYTFIKTSNNVSPFSFFNYIVYNPDQFNNTELEQIITHEKVHVCQRHSLDIILTQLACIIFWFNPIIWFYYNELKQNLEFIADKKAIHFSNCKKSYQYTLLKASLPTHQLAITNNFYNSLIKKRIVMLHKTKSKKINLLKFTLIIPFLALFLMSFNTEKIYLEKGKSEVTNEKSKTLNKSLIEAVISKDFSDSDFEKLKLKFKNEGLTLKIQGVKRNKQREITAIKIDVSSKSSNANFSIATDTPINPIKITIGDDGKNISIENGKLKKTKKIVFVSEDGTTHELDLSDPDKNIFIDASDDDHNNHKNIKIKKYLLKDGDSTHTKTHYKNIDSDDDVIFILKAANVKKNDKVFKKVFKDDNEVESTWTTDENEKVVFSDESDDDFIKIVSKDGTEPLYIVDGKEINKEEMNDISPETIAEIEVLKGESATKKYGDKGKNGVVLITTKKS